MKVPETLTIEEALRTKRIPPNLFQGYIKSANHTRPIPSNIRLANIPSDSEIIIQCIRNTDLRDVLPQKTFYVKADDPITTVSDLNLGGQGCTETIREINAKLAKSIVKNKISHFIETYSSAELTVVGISGGGDSNTLVKSIKSFSTGRLNRKFVFFTLVFDPLWPNSAAVRAAELCHEHNVQHSIYDTKKIEELLNMKRGLDKCYGEFCKKFGDDTSHFFGTFLISFAARRLCQEYKTDEYILGFNREDLLAELLFSLINGQKPLAFPIRQFDKIKLLMPLWEMPKLVLDACYPKYSLSNYKEKKDVTTFQRNVIYYLAHGIEDVYPNLGLSLMQGIQKIFANNWSELKHERNQNLYPSEYADKSKVDEMKSFLGKYFKLESETF